MGSPGRGPGVFLLLLLLFLLLVSSVSGMDVAPKGFFFAKGPPAHFLFQVRAECHISNGTGTGAGAEEPEAHVLFRYIYDRRDIIHLDSAVGHFEALSPQVESRVENLNQDPEAVRQRIESAKSSCQSNYGLFKPFALQRKIQPKLKITPTDYGSSSSRKTLLVCSVDSFYPPKVKTTWLRNGEEEKGPQVITMGPIRNGDWTYGVQVTLETKPERGDVYTCQVEHASLASPASVQWEPHSDSARSKRWTGVLGILLGVAFVAAGLSFYLRNKKGPAVPPATDGLVD